MANTTWNPADKTAGTALTNANLTATASAGGNGVRTVDRLVVGKYYWEYTFTTASNNACGVGIQGYSLSLGAQAGANTANLAIVNNTGSFCVNTVTPVAFGVITSGTVVCFALDLDNRLIFARVGAAGNWNNSSTANPTMGVGGISVLWIGAAIPAYGLMTEQNGTNGAITANFGDSAFIGAVPSGFTSGFTAGVTSSTNALATQVAAEHWLTTNPDAQITQVALEHWASVASDNLQAVVTQVALEHWASVANVSTVTSGPMVTMIG